MSMNKKLMATKISGNVIIVGTVATQFPTVEGVQFILRSLDTNSGDIYLAGSAVASGIGLQVRAGDRIEPEVDNLNRIYGYAEFSGEKMTFIAGAK